MKKLTRQLLVGTGLAAALFFQACSDSQDTPTEFGGFGAGLDAAVFAADDAASDLAFMNGHGVRGLTLLDALFPPFEGDRPDCPEEGGRFRCPPMDREGIDISRTITFLAGDASQDGYDEETTSSILFELSMSGDNLGRGGMTMSVSRERTLTLDGLVGDEASGTWNGTGTSFHTRSGESPRGDTFSMESNSTTTFNDVVMPHPRTPEGWPLSGSITTEISMTGTFGGETQSRDAVAVLTFNGTQFVTLKVGEEEIEIDLADPRRMRGRRRGGRGPGGGGGF